MLCEAISNALLEVEDVDAEDSSNPELCSEYVKDICKYMKELEVGSGTNGSSSYRDNLLTGSLPVIIEGAWGWHSFLPVDFQEALTSDFSTENARVVTRYNNLIYKVRS